MSRHKKYRSRGKNEGFSNNLVSQVSSQANAILHEIDLHMSGGRPYGGYTDRRQSFQGYGDLPEQGIAPSIYGKLIDMALGPVGLKYAPSIDADIFDMLPGRRFSYTSDQVRELTSQIGEYWNWFRSYDDPDSGGIEYSQQYSFLDLVRLVIRSALKHGDGFLLIVDDNRSVPNLFSLALQGIHRDSVSSGFSSECLVYLSEESGMVYDDMGILRRIRVSKKGEPLNTQERDIIDSEGFRRVCHLPIYTELGQPRGEALLKHIKAKLEGASILSQAEIQAALVNALFVLVITGGSRNSGVSPIKASGPGVSDRGVSAYKNLDLDFGSIVEFTNPDAKVNVVSPERPNSGYSGFADRLDHEISASSGVSKSVATGAVNNSYSAIRGELSLTQLAVDRLRSLVAERIYQPIFTIALDRMVSTGSVNIPGYSENAFIRRVWRGDPAIQWEGPPNIVIDESRAALADQVRVNSGVMSRTQAARKRFGANWVHTAEDLLNEHAILRPLRSES